MLLIETSQDLLEVKAQIAGIRRYFAESGRRVPIQAQVTLDTSGRMLLGTDIAAAATVLEALRVDAIGLNCSTGPEHMRQAVRWLCENSRAPDQRDPERRHPAQRGRHGRLPARAGCAGRGARGVRHPLRREHRRRLLRYDARAHAAVVERVWGREPLGGWSGSRQRGRHGGPGGGMAAPAGPTWRRPPRPQLRWPDAPAVPRVASAMTATDLVQEPRPR